MARGKKGARAKKARTRSHLTMALGAYAATNTAECAYHLGRVAKRRANNVTRDLKQAGSLRPRLRDMVDYAQRAA